MSKDVNLTLKVGTEITPEAQILLASPPPWRARTVQILQIVGVLLGLLGTADVMNMIQALSPEVAAWLALSGAALRFGIEPLVLLIGDLVDDGKINKSFKINPVVMLAMVCLTVAGLMSSCNLPPGLEIVTHSQYGSARYKDGIITAEPTVPLTFPIRGTK
jgi:hypothetical protein